MRQRTDAGRRLGARSGRGPTVLRLPIEPGDTAQVEGVGTDVLTTWPLDASRESCPAPPLSPPRLPARPDEHSTTPGPPEIQIAFHQRRFSHHNFFLTSPPACTTSRRVHYHGGIQVALLRSLLLATALCAGCGNSSSATLACTGYTHVM